MPVFREARTIKLPGDIVDGALNEAGKSTCASWERHFIFRAGTGSDVEFEAMLSYWMSWYVLPSGREDGLNPYVFPLAIKLAKGERLALAPVYIGSLFRLDECVGNIVKSVGRFHLVTHVDPAFLQLFLWETSRHRAQN